MHWYTQAVQTRKIHRNTNSMSNSNFATHFIAVSKTKSIINDHKLYYLFDWPLKQHFIQIFVVCEEKIVFMTLIRSSV